MEAHVSFGYSPSYLSISLPPSLSLSLSLSLSRSLSLSLFLSLYILGGISFFAKGCADVNALGMHIVYCYYFQLNSPSNLALFTYISNTQSLSIHSQADADRSDPGVDVLLRSGCHLPVPPSRSRQVDGGSRDDPYYVGASCLSSEPEACMGTGREETQFQHRKHGGYPLRRE